MVTAPDILKAAIFGALDNAADGGHADFVMFNPPLDVAGDLNRYDAEVSDLFAADESLTLEAIVPHIEAWRLSKKN